MLKLLANPLAAGFLATLLLAVPLLFPVLALLQLLAPLPILAIALLVGLDAGLQAALAPVIAAFFFTEELSHAAMVGGYFYAFPMLAAWLLRGGWTIRHCTLLALSLVVLLMVVATGFLSLTGVDLAVDVASRIHHYRDQVVAEGASLLAGNPAGLVSFQEAVHFYAEVMGRFLPAIMLSIWFIIQVVNLALVKNLLARLQQPLADTQILAELRLPFGLIWLFIAAVGMTMSSGNLAYLGSNLLMFLTIPYALQGMAICSAFFRRMGVPTPLRLAFWAALVMFKSLMLTIIVLGILDTWFNFRRHLSLPQGSSPSTR
ncbi:MAG: DUF2232 domain-containing protein [Magnetococcales bacterium]|nr:DUF2232 domain-containing protein [Magnetococcales bacterium]NGZ26935.1 DUF2232 domain-containing protein [Magnetococcales bacterium]